MLTTEPSELTQTQQNVVDLPHDARALVFGSAGSGKTQVLIGRIVKLISTDVLAPGEELLVLTFGRETAAELRRRAGVAESATAYVQVSTFDSFATGLLSTINPEGPWKHKSYDPRIEDAISTIRNDQRAHRYLSRLRHVIVDEIQDLVGVRARLLLTLLQHSNGGFTLLGDPAQAIFNFQLKGSAREIVAETLVDSLIETYDGLVSIVLEENFRAQTDQTRSPLKWGTLLSNRNADYAYIQNGLETILLGAELAPLSLLDRRGGTLAVLCFTNAQALLISSALFAEGIAHEFRRTLSDQFVPSWVGQVLGRRNERRLSKAELADLLDGTEGSPRVDEAWNTLKAIDSSSGKFLQLDLIAENIRSGSAVAVPNTHRENITVSTIHRAKGLEFDWVVVVKPGVGTYSRGQSPADEARLLFVALSRARKGLFWIEPPDTKGWSTARDNIEGRWTLASRRYLLGFEVRGSDIRSDIPAGHNVDCGDLSASDIQRYIHDSVCAGNPVSLLLDGIGRSSDGVPRYLLLHGSTVVGETSTAFVQALMRARLPKCGGNSILPVRIGGLRVESIDTVAGTQAAADRAGLEGLGIWNRVRVFGLGNLEYPPTA